MSFTASCVMLLSTVLGQAADAPKLDEKQLVQLLEPYYQEQDEVPKPRWYDSLLRFTTRPLQVKRNDGEVWNSPGVGNSIRGDSQEPDVTFNAGFVSVSADQP